MKWLEDNDREIIEYIKKGLTYSEISNKIEGRSFNSIKCRLLKLGYPYSEYGGKIEPLPNGFKICYTCKKVKDETLFNKNKIRKDGLNSICKSCSKDRSKIYYQDNVDKHKEVTYNNSKDTIRINRKKLWNYYKFHPCVDCGNDNPIVLEFDHRDGVEKKGSISDMTSTGYAWKTIQKEIKKCDVRCSNCHKIRTAIQFEWYKDLI